MSLMKPQKSFTPRLALRRLSQNIGALLRLLVSSNITLESNVLKIDLDTDIWFKSNNVIKQINTELILTDKSDISNIVIKWLLTNPTYNLQIISNTLDRKDFSSYIQDLIPELNSKTTFELSKWKSDILQETNETNINSREFSQTIL